MLRLVWSTLFFVFAIAGSAVGAVSLMGMPVATEIQAAVALLAGVTFIVGVAAAAFPPFPEFRERDPVPPYVFRR